MSVRTDRPPVVPLQSAAGPENPPCPACSNPLFPWVAEPWREAEAVLRCEVCGLGVARAGGSPEEAGPQPGRGCRRRTQPRRVAAWLERRLGGPRAWSPVLLTPESIERLRPEATEPPSPAMSIALMWQTLQNSFTFGRNLALGRSDRVEPTPASEGWQRRLDRAIVVLTALPLLLVAVLNSRSPPPSPAAVGRSGPASRRGERARQLGRGRDVGGSPSPPSRSALALPRRASSSSAAWRRTGGVVAAMTTRTGTSHSSRACDLISHSATAASSAKRLCGRSRPVLRDLTRQPPGAGPEERQAAADVEVEAPSAAPPSRTAASIAASIGGETLGRLGQKGEKRRLDQHRLLAEVGPPKREVERGHRAEPGTADHRGPSGQAFGQGGGILGLLGDAGAEVALRGLGLAPTPAVVADDPHPGGCSLS